MKSSTHLLLLLCLAGASSILGFGFAAAEQPDAASLYKQKCSMCHGPDGKGFSAIHTPDFTDPKWQASVKDKEIADTIKNGKKDTAMKAFGDQLKEDEVHSLVKYIRSLNEKKK